jgi:hypothetical protein
MIQAIVELPVELQAILAGVVLIAVRLLLGKFLPEANLSEIAAAVTTALIVAIQAFLGLIPPEFEAVASAVLRLIVLLLGMVVVFRGYQKARANGFLR